MSNDLLAAWSVTDLVTPVAVRILASLGLLRRIAAEPVPLPRLAAEHDLREPTLRRILRLLALRGVVRIGPGEVVEATPVGRILGDGPGGAFSTRLDWSGAAGTLDRLVLDDCLAAVRGRTPEDLWSRLDGDPGFSRSFDALMAARAGEWLAPVVALPLWREAGRVVELGGGRGHLLTALLDAWPELRGTLVDRAAVVTDLAASLAAEGRTERLSVEPGDFFAEVPAGGDVYLLAHVLHDWNDEQAARILATAARAAGPGGRIAVVERVVDEDPDPTDPAALETAIQDLRLHVLFDGGERTERQFRELAARAGLVLADSFALSGRRRLLLLTPAAGGGVTD